MAEEIERVNYYQLEYLGAEDFKAEQAYHRDMRRRHNVGHHTWGIVAGLELIEQAKPNGNGFDVFVRPGFAIDGFGREIVVGAPRKLDPADFASFLGSSATHKIFIAYQELTDTPPTYGYTVCEGEDQNKRIHEQFRIVVDPKKERDPIVVDGRDAGTSVPEDASVPFQELPENPRAVWLVRLGAVTWNPATQQFEATADAKRDADRPYAGIVAASVLSPTGTLTLRRRAGGAVDDEAFAEVKGRLQVDSHLVAKKNIYLHGGRVSWQTSGAVDDDVPLWINRLPNATSDGYDLRVHIGKDSGTNLDKHRLTVGAGSNEDDPKATTEKTFFAVKGDNTVDIPTGRLFFGTDVRQMINLWKKEYGIGVQAGTLYNRSSSDFAWYRGGTEAPAQGDAGGGTLAMRLNAANILSVPGGVQTQGDVYVDGGKLQLRLASGGTDTDELSITRFRRAPDQNDLRVIIGDNLDGQDGFSVGPVSFVDGQFKEAFRVTNVGDTTVGRNLAVNGQVTSDLHMQSGKAIMYNAARFPIDVVTGEALVNITNTTVIAVLSVSSRLPSISGATLLVALSDISNDNVATDARWRVSLVSSSIAGNTGIFNVQLHAHDIDGHLNSFSWAAIFFA